jgi:hypothetical protein
MLTRQLFPCARNLTQNPDGQCTAQGTSLELCRGAWLDFVDRARRATGRQSPGALQGAAQHELDLGVEAPEVVAGPFA